MTNNDNKNVEFETVPEVTEKPVTGRDVTVEQKVINPPSGIAALIILFLVRDTKRSKREIENQETARKKLEKANAELKEVKFAYKCN